MLAAEFDHIGGAFATPWQSVVDGLRVLEILGSVPLLFFAVARIFQSPSGGQRALSVSSACYVTITVYGLLERLGDPFSALVPLALLAVVSGLYGGWHFYRGDSPRQPPPGP